MRWWRVCCFCGHGHHLLLPSPLHLVLSRYIQERQCKGRKGAEEEQKTQWDGNKSGDRHEQDGSAWRATHGRCRAFGRSCQWICERERKRWNHAQGDPVEKGVRMADMRSWSERFALAVPGWPSISHEPQGVTTFDTMYGLAWMHYTPVGFVDTIILADALAHLGSDAPRAFWGFAARSHVKKKIEGG